MVELHCPVVCFQRDSQKILIAKRSDTREYFPGKWEFGCAKPSTTELIQDAVIREYKNDFNIIPYIMHDTVTYYENGIVENYGVCPANMSYKSQYSDEWTQISSPSPISFYEMTKNDGSIVKGIVFEADFLEKESDIKLTYKHSEFKLVTLEEAYNMNRSIVVPTFHITLSAYLNLN